MSDNFGTTLGGPGGPDDGGSDDSESQEDRASDNPPPDFEFGYPDDLPDPPDKEDDE